MPTTKKPKKVAKPTSKKSAEVTCKKVAAKTARKGAIKASPKGRKVAARKAALSVKQSQEPAALETVITTDTPVIQALAPRHETMLLVPFDDAMQVHPLLDDLGRQAQFSLVNHLASHCGDVMAAALTGASVVIDRGTMIVRFSQEGSKLLKAKELKFMGGNLPILVNRSGKTVENARLMGPLAKNTRIAANLTVAAVTIAHIVSGADLAKKLNKLDSKVDFLVAAHRNDQLARIEGVYRQAKEILHMEQNDQTRWELHRLGRELFEVRSAWRREIIHHVSSLQKSEESLNSIVGFFQGCSRKGKDQKVAQTVSSRSVEIQLISGSIAIHIALAKAAGTLDTFLKASLPDELAELRRVRMLLNDRRYYIHEKHPELRENVSEACSQLDDVLRIYRSMVVPTQALEETSSNSVR